MLEEAGVAYDIETIDIHAPRRQDSAEFRAASPLGKVPALVDGEVAISESAAICLYLADRYASGVLVPAPDDPLRGRFPFWIFYTSAVFEPAMSDRFNEVEVVCGRSGWGNFELIVEVLEQRIGSQAWIHGEQFPAADVMLGSSVLFLRQFGILPASAALLVHAEHCAARRGYNTARELEPATR